MQANAKSLSFLATEKKVTIPFFQRPYVWDKENWEELLKELKDTTRNHFLGSLILKGVPRNAGDPTEVLVIDGQQRLTTLSILIRVLFDLLDEEKQNRANSQVENLLRYRIQPLDEKTFIKINQSKNEAPHFDQVITYGVSKEDLNTISLSDNSKDPKIKQCYKFFYQELYENYSNNDRSQLLNYLLSDDNKIFVVINIDDTENEQAIFDTINSAGVRLTSADIIKNAIFQKAFEIYEDNELVNEHYEEYWNNVFFTDEEIRNYWETKVTVGRLSRDNMEILLHSIGVIKGFYDPDKHVLSDLAKVFKSEINKITNKDNLRELLEEIKSYATIFKTKLAVLEKNTDYEYIVNDSGLRLNHILQTLNISALHPYLLHIYKTYEKDSQTLNKFLLKLERLVILDLIQRGTISKNYNKEIRKFIDDESFINYKLKDYNTDSILTGLKSLPPRVATLLLFWIELHRRCNKEPENYDKERHDEELILPLKYLYTLEHIMPKEWNANWQNISIDGEQLPNNEETINLRNKAINSIGNMTLLRSKLNTTLRNRSFDDKLNGSGKYNGMRHYSTLSITVDDIINPYDAGQTIWNEQRIDERTKKLMKEILEIWPLASEEEKEAAKKVSNS